MYSFRKIKYFVKLSGLTQYIFNHTFKALAFFKIQYIEVKVKSFPIYCLGDIELEDVNTSVHE